MSPRARDASASDREPQNLLLQTRLRTKSTGTSETDQRPANKNIVNKTRIAVKSADMTTHRDMKEKPNLRNI